jgi:hypothetical protein
MQQATRPPRTPRKEAFFVSVATGDGVSFYNVTDHIGKEMPFTAPKGTCAMRASTDAISFSLLHLTKRAATNIVAAPIQMPHGPLARLERKAAQFGDIDVADVVVEHGVDDENRPVLHRMKISRDENNVASLEMAEGDDVVFELPKGAVNLSIYLKAPRLNRVIGVGFIGHIGKPGDDSTLTRAVSMALFSLSQLTEFRILSNIETVDVPNPPARTGVRRPVRQTRDKAVHTVQTRLFSADPQPQAVGQGHVVIEVDLDNANPASGRLLFHYTPSDEIAAAFDAYRAVYDGAIATEVTKVLGADEITNITYDIVLGAVDSGAIERLNTALRTVTGLDLTPSQYRAWEA